MKIGILTFHHVANHGAVWQASSLTSWLQTEGHTVEIIDFRPRAADKIYRQFFLGNKLAPFYALKAWNLMRDLRRAAKLSPKTIREPAELSTLRDRHDCVIVGSDEVWNIEGLRGWCPAFFLDFVADATRKVSYAASTGHRIDPGSRTPEIQNLLQRFTAISVRDQSTAAFVESLLDSPPCLVVDPTLLAGTAREYPITHRVAVYGSLPLPVRAWLMKNLAASGGRAVSFGFANGRAIPWKIHCGLDGWLQGIGSAQVVLTTTFHGVLAAVVSRRPFWVFPRGDGATKVDEFLRDFDLLSRKLDPAHLPPALDDSESIDFDALWEKLNLRIETSRQFLRDALEV